MKPARQSPKRRLWFRSKGVLRCGSRLIMLATAPSPLLGNQPYILRVQKPGFYQAAMSSTDPETREIRVVLYHEQMLIQQVSVTASVPGIDPEQTTDSRVMNVAEIIKMPYPTSRDIRTCSRLPGVIADETGQVHVVGSETYATLDTLDGFDIRSPVSGNLAMRFSADAVRSIDERTTRYPVEYGRATGGVIAFTTVVWA